MATRILSPTLLALSALLAAAARGAPPRSAAAPHASSKQLVLDSRIVDRTEGLKLVLGTVEKEARNPLFTADKPWENALNNLYPNVQWDEKEQRFKLWYKCVLADPDVIAKMVPPRTVHDVGWFLCYATSRDGITWEKPALGINGFDGSTENNITARDTPNVGVFRDPHDADPSRRFKMIYDVGMGEMRVRFSADGTHWGEPLTPEGLGRVGDTHNNAFWDERIDRYVLLTRLYLGERLVARSESRDFLHWETPKLVLRSTLAEGRGRQAYCMPAFPYANVYLGFVMIYNVGTDRSVDCELTWSPDGISWERVAPGTPFIPRGPKGTYDSGCIYAQAGPPVLRDGRLWIYYGGSAAVHTGWKRHCLPSLARLRPDGFAAYTPEQPGGAGSLTTQPMLCTGEPLRLSADAHGGSIRVAVLDAKGFAATDCQPVRANVTGGIVGWQGGKDLSALKGRVVRLRFDLRGARLYAFSGLQQIPRPVLSPDVHHIEEPTTVTMAAPPAGARVRYTLNGGVPTLASTVYAAPLRIWNTTRVRARVFLPGVREGGPITDVTYTRREPWSLAHPGEPAPVVERRATFNEGVMGWRGESELLHEKDDPIRGGYVSARRGSGNPFAFATGGSGGDTLLGDLEARYRGTGVRISFLQRTPTPGRATQVELFAGDIAQWSWEGPPPTRDWSPVSITLRYDWDDAEAIAHGWKPSTNAFSWRETVHHVGRVVAMPLLSGTGGSFDLDDFSLATVYE